MVTLSFNVLIGVPFASVTEISIAATGRAVSVSMKLVVFFASMFPADDELPSALAGTFTLIPPAVSSNVPPVDGVIGCDFGAVMATVVARVIFFPLADASVVFTVSLNSVSAYPSATAKTLHIPVDTESTY